MKKNIFISILILCLLLPCFCFFAAGENQDIVVYVSPNGNDSGDGSSIAPFKTLAGAFKNLGDGGTVVITGKLSKDVTIFDSSVTKLCSNKKPILITGKDPFTGKIYENATLPQNSVRIYGEIKIEHLTIAPTRNFAFINTYGNPVIFGEGVKTENFGIYFHGGTFGNGTVENSYIEVGSGSITTAYMGGAFVTDTNSGVRSKSTFVLNSGSVSNLCIGFDSSADTHKEGNIFGNVAIRINGGIINKITTKLLKNNSVGGYLAIISKDGNASHIENMPTAQKGTYLVTYTGNGKVFETDEAGVFELVPEKGYCAFVNGKKVTSKNVSLPQGESTVKFLRDTVASVYDGILVDGNDEGFFPNRPATRLDLATMAARALLGEYVFPEFETLCEMLSEKNALPEGWDSTNPEESVTRAECVYILASLFDAGQDSIKLFDFRDLPDYHPYADEIYKAAGAGKVKGSANDDFFPDKIATRAELCEIACFYFERQATEPYQCSYGDVDEKDLTYVICASSSRDSGRWDYSERSFCVPENTSAKSLISSLHSQSAYLSPEKIRDGSDEIARIVRENILSAKNTSEIYDFDALGITKTYYVSEKNGNDSNDGLSPQSAFKTPEALVKIVKNGKNVAVLFERNGIYRTGTLNPLNLSGSKNIILGSYGEGSKPIIMQSRRNYANDTWIEVAPNIYRLETPLRNVGVMAFDHDVFDHTDATFEEKFGEMKNIDTDGFTGISDLTSDLQFYSVLQPKTTTQTSTQTDGGITYTTTTVTESYDRFTEGYLYLYSDKGNPSERFRSIEIGENYDLVDGGAHGCVIDNISFKFTGSHGIGLGNSEGVNVSNCIFSWLGGSILWEAEKVTTTVKRNDTGEKQTTITTEEATCYGNAVEIYGSCDGYYVRDNWIYQIFDDGITNQFHGETACIQKDIEYTGNLMEYVYHMFSNSKSHGGPVYGTDFPTEGLDAPDTYTAGLLIADNICRMAGYGWGGPIKSRVHTGMMYRTYVTTANKDELVQNNLFDSSGGYVVFSYVNANDTYDGNIYIQPSGTRLLSKAQVGNFPFDSEAHRDIISLFGDTRAVTVLADKDTIKNYRREKPTLEFVGAQLRAGEAFAIRFLFSVDKDLYENLSPDEIPTSYNDVGAGVGTVFFPEVLMGERELYKNTIASKNPAAKAAVVPAVKLYEVTDDKIIFTLCITDILPDNYTRKFVARPYLSYEDDGVLKNIYGEQTSGISLFDIAEFVYSDKRNSEEMRNAVYDRILSVSDPEKYPAK